MYLVITTCASRYFDTSNSICNYEIVREKGRDLTQSYNKSPTPSEKSKKQRDNIKTPPKTSITQRLRTDLGQSVGVTAVNPTGVVEPVYERSTFPLTATAVTVIKRTHI